MFSATILVSFIFSDLIIFEDNRKENLLKGSYQRIILKESNFINFFEKSGEYLKAIEKSPDFQEYLKNQNKPGVYEDVKNLLYTFSQSDKSIMQGHL